ncbi:IS5 family transposase [Streptomyces sp. NPDC001093]|uniref:IS5 family transposase n=1 Tax=Streptomyces sp. NPDC001093 TaxID=3154376 RepID=UPI003319557A
MRGDLSEAEWELVEPHLPLGERGPILNLRRHFNAVMWRFRTGSPWRDIPERYGPWSTVYGRFQIWVAAGTFQTLMDTMIAEAASRGQVDLSLVSVDSTVSRAHHHAAGMAVDPELPSRLRRTPQRRHIPTINEGDLHALQMTRTDQPTRNPINPQLMAPTTQRNTPSPPTMWWRIRSVTAPATSQAVTMSHGLAIQPEEVVHPTVKRVRM